MKVNEIITNKIISELQKGIVPWQRSWTIMAPMNIVSKKPYRGINVILLKMTEFHSPYFITFKQAMDLGGSVKKGEHGTMVVYYKLNEYLDENSDELLRRVPLLRYYNVFNVEQCEGLESKIPPTMSRIINPIEECEKIVEGYTNKPHMLESDRAAYAPHFDNLFMPPMNSFDTSEGYYATLFHEYVHSTGHKDRLSRKEIENVKPFGSEDYSKEELVAEIGSIFLYNKVGITRPFNNSVAYIGNWMKRLSDDHNLIISAASQAQKAYDYILKTEAKEEEEVA